MTTTRWAAALMLLCTYSAPAHIGTPSAPDAIHNLESVPASTTASGPPMWEFSRGGKRILVLGTMTYLPGSLAFDSTLIEGRIGQAQVVVSSPGLVVGDNISIFRGLTLWPGIRRNKFNANDRTLRDVLSPDDYARWEASRRPHPGHNTSVERLRPMYAAMELFESAAEGAQLRRSASVAELVKDVARRRGIAVIDARFRLSIDDPRNATKRFDVPASDDVACLKQTMDRLDTFLNEARGTGEAWANGDMEVLEAWAARSTMRFCWSTLTNRAIARQQGIDDLDGQVNETWMRDILKALDNADTVFTTLPIRDLLGSDGLGSSLRRAGFVMTPLQ